MHSRISRASLDAAEGLDDARGFGFQHARDLVAPAVQQQRVTVRDDDVRPATLETVSTRSRNSESLPRPGTSRILRMGHLDCTKRSRVSRVPWHAG
jgi:hypothetical protein